VPQVPAALGVVTATASATVIGAAATIAVQQRLGRLLRLRPGWMTLRRWR
jgi:hypothetical protein